MTWSVSNYTESYKLLRTNASYAYSKVGEGGRQASLWPMQSGYHEGQGGLQVVLDWYCYQKAQQQATVWGSWVQSWSWLREALDKVCGNPASSSSINALVSEVQQLKSVLNDAGLTCSRTGIGSVIQAWRKVVQKAETKSQSKAAAAMWQNPAADMAALESDIPRHGDQLSPSITISRTNNPRTLPG